MERRGLIACGTSIALFTAIPDADAGWKTRLLEAAGVGIGVDLAAQASTLVGTAVAIAASANCAATHCANELVTFIHGHPLVGRRLVDHELNVYMGRHPQQLPLVAQVRNALAETAVAAPAKPIDRNGLPIASSIPTAPGDCTPQDQSALQDAVDVHCKGIPSRCGPTDSVEALLGKLERNRLCMSARNIVMKKCFRGGDIEHRVALDNAIGAVSRCERMLEGR